MKKYIVLWVLASMLMQVFGLSHAITENTDRCVKCNIIVSSKFCPDCGEEITKQKPILNEGEGYLTLDISCAKNKILAKRDADVYIDGEKVATIPHGESWQKKIALEKGMHTLKFCAADNASHFVEDVVDVWLDTNYSCTLKMHCFSVENMQVRTDGFVSEEKKARHFRETFCAACKEVDYETYARYPSQYTNEKIQVTGTIMGMTVSKKNTTIIMADKDGNEWIINAPLLSQEPRLMVNDQLIVYGTANGLQACTELGSYSHLVPAVSFEYYTMVN